jgi:hypothetical protein
MCITSEHILHTSNSFNIYSFDIRKCNASFSETSLRTGDVGGGGGIVKLVGDDTKLACVTQRCSSSSFFQPPYHSSKCDIIPHLRGHFLSHENSDKAISWEEFKAPTRGNPNPANEVRDVELHENLLAVSLPSGVRVFDLSVLDPNKESFQVLHDHSQSCAEERHLKERKLVAAERSLASARRSDGDTGSDDAEDEVERRRAAVRARQQAKKLAQVEKER